MSKKSESGPQEGINPKTVHQNFSLWEKTLHTKDPKAMARLYAENATFLPTVSGEFKKGQTGVEEYFEHFLEKNPTGEIIEEETQTLGPDCYLHSGLYNFEVGPNRNRQIVEARFTFLWKQNSRGEWKIIHHHSSIKCCEKVGKVNDQIDSEG